MKGKPVLIYANFQDMPNTLSSQKIKTMFELDSFSDRQIRVQECSGKTGEGVVEGLDWLQLN